MQNVKTVECHLRLTYHKLAETEANVFMFTKLKALDLATNDVANFIVKQTIHKKTKSNSKPDLKVQRAAMGSKLVDAIAYCQRLRRERNVWKRKVVKKYVNEKSKGRKLLQNLVDYYRSVKEK